MTTKHEDYALKNIENRYSMTYQTGKEMSYVARLLEEEGLITEEAYDLIPKRLKPDGILFDRKSNTLRILEIISSNPLSFDKAEKYYSMWDYFNTDFFCPRVCLDLYFLGQFTQDVCVFSMLREYENR